jgi:AcrR family transcriptional regulator
MPRPVKPRGYHSPLRAEQAQRTRLAILAAARRLFVEKGYAATTVATIAAEAGVAVDTVYAAVGPKPAVFRLLVETAISGTDEAVPALQRDYVQRIRQAATARAKIEVYAAALREIAERMAPLFLVLRTAAPHADELAEMHREIGERRARNMLLFAEDLAATGELRPELPLSEVADIIWSMNSAEYYALLVHERGWTPSRFERFLVDAWCRLLIAAQ